MWTNSHWKNVQEQISSAKEDVLFEWHQPITGSLNWLPWLLPEERWYNFLPMSIELFIRGSRRQMVMLYMKNKKELRWWELIDSLGKRIVNLLDKKAHQTGTWWKRVERNMGWSTITSPHLWLYMFIFNPTSKKLGKHSQEYLYCLGVTDDVNLTFFICNRWEQHKRLLKEYTGYQASLDKCDEVILWRMDTWNCVVYLTEEILWAKKRYLDRLC